MRSSDHPGESTEPKAEPHGVQLRRSRGWRLPANTVVVTRASKRWGNPFVIGKNSLFGAVPDAATAVSFYRRWLITTTAGRDVLVGARQVLRGRNLACFCGLDQPCHRSVLIEFANSDGPIDAPTANAPTAGQKAN